MALDRLPTIGEAVRRSKVRDQTLQAWERNGFVRLIRLPSGYRRCTQEELDRVKRGMGLLPGENPAAALRTAT